MHVVIRLYSGEGAKDLFEMLIERRDEIEEMMKGVADFRSYTLIRTDMGGASITCCEDKFGTDRSTKLAREWIVSHASNLNIAAPIVAEGEVLYEFHH